jgi:peptidase M1-like protein
MQGRGRGPALSLALLALVAVTPGMVRAGAGGADTRAVVIRADAAADDLQRSATESMARAEAALRDLSRERLAEAFGVPPDWAREWVEGRGKDDLFDRQWKGAAVRLPRPYHGAEWLGVFSMYHPVEADADHVHRLEQRDGRWVLGPEIDEREPAAEYQITHHELQVRLMPAEHRMEATDRMTVRRLAQAGGLLLARMNDDYQVAEVRVEGAPAPFARAGGLLAVAMPEGPPASLSVMLKYGAVVEHAGVDNIDPEAAFLFSYWYPNVARLPATGDITITAPAAWTTIAQGEQRSRVMVGEEARTRWRQTHPVCWLQLVSGPYIRTSRSVGEKQLNVYLLKPNAQKAAAALDALTPALSFYSRTFAPFPWTHYDVVQYPMTLGALEAYSFTTASLELIPQALPHELAHSWWGGLVPNPYTVDMWNEAFATYSERLLREATATGPPPGLRAGEDRRGRRRYNSPAPIIGAVDALTRSHSITGYNKGAAVLHMFRRTVGDEKFLRSLARFAKEMAGRAATWRDFQRCAETETGQELGWFFDPWLTRTDTPRVRWVSARQKGDRLEAEIELANPAYRLRLPIAIDTADGKRQIDTLETSGTRTQLHRTLTARVVRLVLDPRADFLLEPIDSRANPWTIELGASETATLRPAARRRPVEPWVGTSGRSMGLRRFPRALPPPSAGSAPLVIASTSMELRGSHPGGKLRHGSPPAPPAAER